MLIIVQMRRSEIASEIKGARKSGGEKRFSFFSPSYLQPVTFLNELIEGRQVMLVQESLSAVCT